MEKGFRREPNFLCFLIGHLVLLQEVEQLQLVFREIFPNVALGLFLQVLSEFDQFVKVIIRR